MADPIEVFHRLGRFDLNEQVGLLVGGRKGGTLVIQPETQRPAPHVVASLTDRRKLAEPNDFAGLLIGPDHRDDHNARADFQRSQHVAALPVRHAN